jgi:hypothetical protein
MILAAAVIYTHFLLSCPRPGLYATTRVHCRANAALHYACGVRPRACTLVPRTSGGGETPSPAFSF